MDTAPNPYPLLARFNRWVNRRFYDLCAGLSDEERKRDRQAFFGSIHNTLNHILLVDRLYLDRILRVRNGTKSFADILHDDFEELRAAREQEDERLIGLVDRWSADDLSRNISYRYLSGVSASTPLHLILLTLFNHQTHHRGQVHAMLTHAGIRPPDSDIVEYLEEMGPQAGG